MSKLTLAHQIPMELVNKILITRPTHPLAKLFKHYIYPVYSTKDGEGRIYYVIDNKFVICISGNNSIESGDVCKLDEQGQIDLPFARSGYEMISIVWTAFEMKYICSKWIRDD